MDRRSTACLRMKSEHNRILKLLSVLLLLLPEADPVYLFAVTRPNRHSKFQNQDTNLVREMETEESLLIVYQPDSKLRSNITETSSTVSLEITSRDGSNPETPGMEQNGSEDQYAVSFGDVSEEEIVEGNLPPHRREKRNVQVDYKRSNHSLETRSRRGKIFLYPRVVSYDDLGKEREQVQRRKFYTPFVKESLGPDQKSRFSAEKQRLLIQNLLKSPKTRMLFNSPSIKRLLRRQLSKSDKKFMNDQNHFILPETGPMIASPRINRHSDEVHSNTMIGNATDVGTQSSGYISHNLSKNTSIERSLEPMLNSVILSTMSSRVIDGSTSNTSTVEIEAVKTDLATPVSILSAHISSQSRGVLSVAHNDSRKFYESTSNVDTMDRKAALDNHTALNDIKVSSKTIKNISFFFSPRYEDKTEQLTTVLVNTKPILNETEPFKSSGYTKVSSFKTGDQRNISTINIGDEEMSPVKYSALEVVNATAASRKTGTHFWGDTKHEENLIVNETVPYTVSEIEITSLIVTSRPFLDEVKNQTLTNMTIDGIYVNKSVEVGTSILNYIKNMTNGTKEIQKNLSIIKTVDQKITPANDTTLLGRKITYALNRPQSKNESKESGVISLILKTNALNGMMKGITSNETVKINTTDKLKDSNITSTTQIVKPTYFQKIYHYPSESTTTQSDFEKKRKLSLNTMKQIASILPELIWAHLKTYEDLTDEERLRYATKIVYSLKDVFKKYM